MRIRNRFDILMKVGMSRKEVKQSINSQVLTVFFLPLIAGGSTHGVRLSAHIKDTEADNNENR